MLSGAFRSATGQNFGFFIREHWMKWVEQWEGLGGWREGWRCQLFCYVTALGHHVI